MIVDLGKVTEQTQAVAGSRQETTIPFAPKI